MNYSTDKFSQTVANRECSEISPPRKYPLYGTTTVYFKILRVMLACWIELSGTVELTAPHAEGCLRNKYEPSVPWICATVP